MTESHQHGLRPHAGLDKCADVHSSQYTAQDAEHPRSNSCQHRRGMKYLVRSLLRHLCCSGPLRVPQRMHLRCGLVLHTVDAGEAALPDHRVHAHRVRTHLLQSSERAARCSEAVTAPMPPLAGCASIVKTVGETRGQLG